MQFNKGFWDQKQCLEGPSRHYLGTWDSFMLFLWVSRGTWGGNFLKFDPRVGRKTSFWVFWQLSSPTESLQQLVLCEVPAPRPLLHVGQQGVHHEAVVRGCRAVPRQHLPHHGQQGRGGRGVRGDGGAVHGHLQLAVPQPEGLSLPHTCQPPLVVQSGRLTDAGEGRWADSVDVDPPAVCRVGALLPHRRGSLVLAKLVDRAPAQGAQGVWRVSRETPAGGLSPACLTVLLHVCSVIGCCTDVSSAPLHLQGVQVTHH